MTKESKRIAAYVVLLVIGIAYLALRPDPGAQTATEASMATAAPAQQAAHETGAITQRLYNYIALDCRKQSFKTPFDANTPEKKKQLCDCVMKRLTAEQRAPEDEDEFRAQCDERVLFWAGDAQRESQSQAGKEDPQVAKDAEAVNAIPESERANYEKLCQDVAKVKAQQLGSDPVVFAELNRPYINKCILDQKRGGVPVAAPAN